jgi:small-conductance mechanosensitive channel
LSAVDDRTVRAIVTAAVWLVVIVFVRWALNHAYSAWEKRHADSDPIDLARRRTTFSFLSRIALTLVVVIGTWSVLSIFPQTQEIAHALLASSAVLAIVAGLALNTPLGNLGSGVLVAFTQPLRLGDRVTIGEQTGFVEQINLIYTTLMTDDDRRIYIPNTQLTTTPIVNRTIRDPRRAVTAALPLRLGAPIAQARAVVLTAAKSAPGVYDAQVTVGDVGQSVVWLNATAYAPLDANVAAINSDLRERALVALGNAGLLPAA